MYFMYTVGTPGGRQYYMYQSDLGEMAAMGKVVPAKSMSE